MSQFAGLVAIVTAILPIRGGALRRLTRLQLAPNIDVVVVADDEACQHEIVDAQVIGAMRPSTYLINIGRGKIVRLDDLVDGLRARPDSMGRLHAIVLENLRRFLDGAPLVNVVDKERWY